MRAVHSSARNCQSPRPHARGTRKHIPRTDESGARRVQGERQGKHGSRGDKTSGGISEQSIKIGRPPRSGTATTRPVDGSIFLLHSDPSCAATVERSQANTLDAAGQKLRLRSVFEHASAGDFVDGTAGDVSSWELPEGSRIAAALCTWSPPLREVVKVSLKQEGNVVW